jgi:hypothetical protein
MKRLTLAMTLISLIGAPMLAQQNGQPATEVLGSVDLNGYPTFMGGVTNGGPNGHSVW